MQWHDLKLFEREAQVLKNLAHPRVPRYRFCLLKVAVHCRYLQVKADENTKINPAKQSKIGL